MATIRVQVEQYIEIPMSRVIEELDNLDDGELIKEMMHCLYARDDYGADFKALTVLWDWISENELHILRTAVLEADNRLLLERIRNDIDAVLKES